jgi:hypothetical protein
MAHDLRASVLDCGAPAPLSRVRCNKSVPPMSNSLRPTPKLSRATALQNLAEILWHTAFAPAFWAAGPLPRFHGCGAKDSCYACPGTCRMSIKPC